MTDLIAVPMTAVRFEAFMDLTVSGYADDAATAGSMTREAAEAKARGDVSHILTDGLSTAGQVISTLSFEDNPVGHLWIGRRGEGASAVGWIWDVFVQPEFRGRGLGADAMRIAEQQAVEQLGVTEIQLNVFGANASAIRLYQRLGYQTISQQMSKSL